MVCEIVMFGRGCGHKAIINKELKEDEAMVFVVDNLLERRRLYLKNE